MSPAANKPPVPRVAAEDTPTLREVKATIDRIFDEFFRHDGFAEFRVEMRILKRSQKEVIVHCGKQHRFVLDFLPDGSDRPAG